jgi:ABC-type oligopeptide transport system substrate-binding subunit
VLPLETLGKSVPWLPLDEDARPVSNIVAFNTLQPPFNSPAIRQAFAQAIDREVIAGMAAKYGTRNIGPATTLTPPITLGRDLYNEVGAVFDPQGAKDLLVEAGYTDASTFPIVTIVVNASGDVRPGARFNMATAMAGMWKEHLGVTVQVEAIGNWKAYGERLRSNPPEMFWLGWAADFNDPDNFLRGIFHTDSEYNFGRFSNTEFDRLVNRARIGDPAARQELYISAERLLTEEEAALIPLYYTVQ